MTFECWCIRYALLRCAWQCFVLLCRALAMLWYATLCSAMLCRLYCAFGCCPVIQLWFDLLCFSTARYASLCFVLLCHASLRFSFSAPFGVATLGNINLRVASHCRDMLWLYFGLLDCARLTVLGYTVGLACLGRVRKCKIFLFKNLDFRTRLPPSIPKLGMKIQETRPGPISRLCHCAPTVE